jgi:hypothetical protein
LLPGESPSTFAWSTATVSVGCAVAERVISRRERQSLAAELLAVPKDHS